MKKRLVFALLTLTVAALSAQTLPSGATKMASMGGITEYDYPNGLRVLLLYGQGNSAKHRI